MARPVLIGVELVQVTDEDGKTRKVPDIGAKLRERFVNTGPGIYTASWGEHALTVRRLGRVNGVLWFHGSGSVRILKALAHLGAKVVHAKDLTATQRTWALSRGLKPIRRKRDGAIVGVQPPVVFGGEHPVGVGMDGATVEGEEYE